MEERKYKKQTINILINLGFLLAIIFVCVILTLAIIILYKNMEIIRNDPITYVMKQMNFTSCNCELGSQKAAVCGCTDLEGKFWKSHDNMFKHEKYYETNVRTGIDGGYIDIDKINESFLE